MEMYCFTQKLFWDLWEKEFFEKDLTRPSLDHLWLVFPPDKDEVDWNTWGREEKKEVTF